jgi:hypothetical protein
VLVYLPPRNTVERFAGVTRFVDNFLGFGRVLGG